MENEDKKKEAVKYIRESQIKYIYYVIALNVAAAAFSINQTKDDKLNSIHIILGVAMIFWSIGVFFGFRFLLHYQNALFRSYNSILHIDKFLMKDELLNPQENILNTSKHKKIIYEDEIDSAANKTYWYSQYSFYIGCLIFIVWQVFQMAYFTNSPS